MQRLSPDDQSAMHLLQPALFSLLMPWSHWGTWNESREFRLLLFQTLLISLAVPLSNDNIGMQYSSKWLRKSQGYRLKLHMALVPITITFSLWWEMVHYHRPQSQQCALKSGNISEHWQQTVDQVLLFSQAEAGSMVGDIVHRDSGLVYLLTCYKRKHNLKVQ